VQHHFGHLIADHLTRILLSLHERPQDIYLFTLPPGGSPETVPGYFWLIIDWYGLPRSQIRFVTEPLLIRELRVAPQAEQVRGKGPSKTYLKWLSEIALRNNLAPIASDKLYVSREGILAEGKGGNAGESHLVSCLTRLGIRVLDPQRASLDQQLALYAGARQLIFSEGSAVHGRQLLGYIDQKIAILNRRPDSQTGKAMLNARCTQLDFFEVTRRIGIPERQNGRQMPAKGISFYDLPVLHASFDKLGINLAQVWNTADYEAARDTDITAWLGAISGSGSDSAFDNLGRFKGLDSVRQVFAAEGLRDLHEW
jgi:hypothetical protein